MVMKKSTYPRRLTMVLRAHLTERVLPHADRICQNPNSFVNHCVAACLDAIDSDEITCDLPIVILVRHACRKPTLAAKRIRDVCALFAPNPEDLHPVTFQYLAGLINRHEGPLAKEVIRAYWKLADRMAQDAARFEKELQVFRSEQPSA
jgi:hypothetical protein